MSLVPMKIIVKGEPFFLLADGSKCAGPKEVYTRLRSTWKCREKPVLDQKGQLDVSSCHGCCLLVSPTQFQSTHSCFKTFLCHHGTLVGSS